MSGTRPGNARFVPPPANRVIECMGKLEDFLHDKPVKLPVLMKTALAHVQFETIHPFLDGNGRLGRLLITLLFCTEGALGEAPLYLSLYFKQHRDAYYDCLQRVRTEGDWLGWLRFFLEGVQVTADQATDTSRRIQVLLEEDEKQIATLGRRADFARRLHEHLRRHPILTIPGASKAVGLSQPAVTGVVKSFEELGMLKETTGRQRDRVYGYLPYLTLLEEGTEAGM